MNNQRRHKLDGSFDRSESLANDREWLYQKYVREQLSWDEFYRQYKISPCLLSSRLKEFGIKRERISWNRGTKGIMKANSTSFKNGDKKLPNSKWPEKGEKSLHWKGGITPLVMKIRNSKPMKFWRRNIFDRDSYTCQSCGKVGCQLHADHIFPFSAILKKFAVKSYEEAIKCIALWDLKNGRTLCIPCHKKTPTYLAGATLDIR